MNAVSFSPGFSKGTFKHSDDSFHGDRSLLHLSVMDKSLNSSREISHESTGDFTHNSLMETSLSNVSRNINLSAYSGERSLGESWSFYNYVGGGESGMVFPSTVRNPNKALCTINGKTSEVP